MARVVVVVGVGVIVIAAKLVSRSVRTDDELVIARHAVEREVG